MVAANDCCFGYIGVVDGGILNINGANPFATGFNNIFGAIGDLQETLGCYCCYVTGLKPAFFIDRAVFIAGNIGQSVVAARDPWTSYLQCAEGIAIPRQCFIFFIHDFHFYAEDPTTLQALQVRNLFSGEVFHAGL